VPYAELLWTAHCVLLAIFYNKDKELAKSVQQEHMAPTATVQHVQQNVEHAAAIMCALLAALASYYIRAVVLPHAQSARFALQMGQHVQHAQ